MLINFIGLANYEKIHRYSCIVLFSMINHRVPRPKKDLFEILKNILGRGIWISCSFNFRTSLKKKEEN